LSPRVLYGDAARAALLRGMHAMTALMRPTIGPVPRTVAIERIVSTSQAPEILDSAALIARRTIQLPDAFEDMGAMIVRHLVWRVFDELGDGGATAAIIADALAQAANAHITAGFPSVDIRHGIERALPVAQAELKCMARTVDTPAQIAALVSGALRDAALADIVGEVIDTVGPDGAVLVENAQGVHTSHEYIDGVRWNEGYLSPFLLNNETDGSAIRLLNPRILVTDHSIDRAQDLLPALEACVNAGERRVCVIAPDVRDAGIGLLVVNRERGVLEGAIAVRAPSIGAQRLRILEDLAVIAGGRCISQDRHDRLTDVRLEDLGTARQVWATRAAFGILGGAGTKAALRQRIAEARAELNHADLRDVGIRDKIRERIGKLAGTACIIRVGAPTPEAQEELKLRVEAAVRAARAAVQDGVVPGAGAALVTASMAVERFALAACSNEAVGARALARALTAPFCTILENAGYESAPLLHTARTNAARCVFDVLRGQWLDAESTGILDPLTVVSTALETAVSAAASAMSAEVLVRRKNPPQAFEP
jgi:chaperonin GroEL